MFSILLQTINAANQSNIPDWGVILIFLGLYTPLVLAFIYQEKMNRNRHIFLRFSAPDGSQQTSTAKMGFSWTIFFFAGWALIFRGQFFEWLGFFFLRMILFSSAINVNSSGEVDGFQMFWYSWVILVCLFLYLYYLVLMGNKSRIRKYIQRGFSINVPENGDVSEIYKYAKMTSPTEQVILKPGDPEPGTPEYDAKKATTSDNSIAQVVEENPDDYSTLTLGDLKLLLKSEGISFDSAATKEELLKIADENLKKNSKNEDKIEDFSKLSVADLKLLLKEKNIPFSSSDKKQDLIDKIKESEK